MATDNVTASPGSGGAILRTLSDGTVEHAASVLEYVTGGSAGAWTFQNVDATHGLPVAVVGSVAVTAASLPLPTGASTEATLAALSAKVTAVNTGAVVIASGTIAATQSGAWNITNISGTITLPTGAATESTLGTLNGKVTACNTGAVVISSGTISLPSGASTAAKQPALGTAGTASADVITVQGIASMTALKVDGSAVTQPVSGTFWQATQPVSGTVAVSNSFALDATLAKLTIAQGATLGSNTGAMSMAAVLNTTPTYITGQISPLSINTSGQLRVDASGQTVPVSIAGTPNVNATCNVNQFGSQNVSMAASGIIKVGLTDGSGSAVNKGQTTMSASLPVVIASDQGTFPVTQTPAASGGLSVSRLIVAAGANQDATIVKGSAGQVFGWSLTNVAAAARYVKLYNLASGATSASTPVMTLIIPGNTAGAGNNWETVNGIAFGTGIMFRVCTGIADNDANAATANDCSISIFYK